MRKSSSDTNELHALGHDDEDLARVDSYLARPARSGQPDRRLRVWADDRRVQVAEPINLCAAKEADIDQTTLEVEPNRSNMLTDAVAR